MAFSTTLGILCHYISKPNIKIEKYSLKICALHISSQARRQQGGFGGFSPPPPPPLKFGMEYVV